MQVVKCFASLPQGFTLKEKQNLVNQNLECIQKLLMSFRKFKLIFYYFNDKTIWRNQVKKKFR